MLQQGLTRVFAKHLADDAFVMSRDRWLRLQVRDVQLDWFLPALTSGKARDEDCPKGF